MFDHTLNYIYGIFGYNSWSWIARLVALFVAPLILIILIFYDIIDSIYNLF